jgi:hypothetical protein
VIIDLSWLAAILVILAGIALMAAGAPRRHRHSFELAEVSYPQAAGGLFGAVATTAPNKTNVVYRCHCEQPGGLVSVELLGHWKLPQLKGQTCDEPDPKGGEDQAQVLSLVSRTRNDLLGTDPYAG